MAIAFVVANAEAQGRRAAVGEERATAIEAVAAVAFPGATLDWDNEQLVKADGTREEVALSGFVRLPYGGGQIVASGVEFPAAIERAMSAVKAFKATEPVVSRFVVLRISPTGDIEKKVGVLDPESVVTECRRIDVQPSKVVSEWPYLQVGYSSVHRGSDWVGAVTWNAILDSRTMTMLRKVPVAFWRRTAEGEERSDFIETVRVTASEIQLRGRTTGAQWTYTCVGGCKVPAGEILSRDIGSARQ